MIEVSLYVNTSEANVVNKTLATIGTYQGAFRDSVSITDPVFTINEENVPVMNTLLVNCNYAYIPAFNRYYYVTSVVLVRSGLWQFTCHVDVLKTYWNDIKLTPAVIARQENIYNLYLDDDRFLVTSKRRYNTIAFPGRVASGSDPNATSFILTLAGGVNEDTSGDLT